MSRRKRTCSRRPMWSVAAMGVFACSLTLYGAPGDTPSRTGMDRVDLGDHVLVHPTAKSIRVVSFPSEEGDYVTVRGGFEHAGGSVASVGFPALVYRSQRSNFVSTLLDENLGWIDQILLGNIGTEDSILLRSYRVRACTDVCLAGGRCNPDGTSAACGDEARSGCFNTGESAVWTTQLWTGNPCAQCAGGDDAGDQCSLASTTDCLDGGGACVAGGTRIPGTLFQMELADLGPGQDGLRNCADAIIQLDPKLKIGTEVWVESYIAHDDGWVHLGTTPGEPGNIGSSPLSAFYNETDDVCDSFFADPPPEEDNEPFLAVDVFSNAGTTITLQPKSAHGKPKEPPSESLVKENEIKIPKGGVNIQMEFQISDWSGAGGTTRLKAYQIRLDSSGYTSGLNGTIEEKLVPCEALCVDGLNDGGACNGNSDCADGACEDSGDPCSSADSCDVGVGEDCLTGSCEATDAGRATCFNNFAGICSFSAGPCTVCTDCPFCEPPLNETCDAVSDCLEGDQRLAGFCAPSYIVKGRGDHAMQAGADPLCAVDLSVPDYAPACAVGPQGSAQSYGDIGAPAKGAYAGTIWVHVSNEATGTFTIGIFEFSTTALVDQDSQFIPLVGLIPAKITVQTGQCCDPDFVCQTSSLTENQCLAKGDGYRFDANKNCDDDCACATNADCADDDACTVDVCAADGTCSNTKVNITATQCCQENPTGALTCDNDAKTCAVDADCVGNGGKERCQSDDVNGRGAIVSNDDDNECTNDGCDKGGNRGVPTHTNKPSDTSCDDGDCQTDQDVCGEKDPVSGAPICGGGTIEFRDCTTDADCDNADDPDGCPAGNCDPVALICIKSVPQLVFDIHLSDKDHFCTIGGNPCTSQDDCDLTDPDTGAAENCAVVGGGDCFAQGEKITVDVNFTGASLEAGNDIVGGQFIAVYDPSCLGFVSIVPGGDPFTFQLQSRVDQAAGRIFYAVGVDPFGSGDGAISGTLATMSFVKLAGQNECPNCFLDFDSVNPMNTYLADSKGKVLVLPTKPSKEIHVNDRLSLNIPDNDGGNSECGERGAVFTWDAPTASSSCEDPHGCDPAKKKCYDVNLVCSGSGPKGPYSQAVVMNGGLLDQGRSQFCCTATGKICGDSVNDCWTVDVNDQVSLDITVQLQPIMAATTLTRCIEFQLYEDCIQNPMCFRQDVVFGGNNFIGKSSGKKKIPKAQWACMTARDQSHSLESCTFLECRADGNWEAVFAGDPFFGGNWLIQGNLDEWQKLQPPLFGSPDVIDILDFATFLIQFGQFINPNTPCDPNANNCVDPLAGPHADINGDGVVDAQDFAFIFDNFLTARKACCCDDATAGLPGRTEVSVRELRESGLDDLIVADLNRDGLVNMADMNEFLSGKRPEVKGTSRTRTGSGIGSRR